MENSTEVSSPDIPKKWLLLIALLQGLALLLLHQAIEFKFWPGESRPWLFALYGMVLTGPTMLLLSLEFRTSGKVWGSITAFSLFVGLIGFYTGYQATPRDQVELWQILYPFVLTLAIAALKILMYVQGLPDGRSFDYSFLFRASWRNVFTFCLALVFANITFGLLMLWAYLFESIGIDFFS